MTPEVKFYNQIEKHLPGFVRRIENLVGTGTPDVALAWTELGNFWIELKVSPYGLSAIQETWHMYNALNGGKSFVLTKYPKKKFSNEHILIQKAAVNNNHLVLMNMGVVVKGNYNLIKEKLKHG